MLHTTRSALLVVLTVTLAVACEPRRASSDGNEEDRDLEFAFNGGKVVSGRVELDPNAQVTQDSTGTTILARMANSPQTIEISCACFIEGPGVCFAFEMPDPNPTPDGKRTITCAYTDDCAGQTMDFCAMSIKGLDFQARFRAPATRVKERGNASARSCNGPFALL